MATIVDVNQAVSDLTQAVTDLKSAVDAEIARVEAVIAAGSSDPAALQTVVDNLKAVTATVGGVKDEAAAERP